MAGEGVRDRKRESTCTLCRLTRWTALQELRRSLRPIQCWYSEYSPRGRTYMYPAKLGLSYTAQVPPSTLMELQRLKYMWKSAQSQSLS